MSSRYKRCSVKFKFQGPSNKFQDAGTQARSRGENLRFCAGSEAICKRASDHAFELRRFEAIGSFVWVCGGELPGGTGRTQSERFLFSHQDLQEGSPESWLWLRLLSMGSSSELEATRQLLTKEADELVRILSSIAKKSEAEAL